MNIKITAVRKADYCDLQARFENPIEHACDVREGQTWISVDGAQPRRVATPANSSAGWCGTRFGTTVTWAAGSTPPTASTISTVPASFPRTPLPPPSASAS